MINLMALHVTLRTTVVRMLPANGTKSPQNMSASVSFLFVSKQRVVICNKFLILGNPGYHGDGIDCREKEVSCVEVFFSTLTLG